MKARFLHDGAAIDYVPTVDIAAGSIVVHEDLIGIAKLDMKANVLGALHVVGVYEVQKGSLAFTLGEKVYWSEATQSLTKTTTDKWLGIAVSDTASDEELVRVRIG